MSGLQQGGSSGRGRSQHPFIFRTDMPRLLDFEQPQPMVPDLMKFLSARNDQEFILLKMDVLRDLELRSGHEQTFLDNRPARRLALFIQTRGADAGPCDRCKNGTGPFKGCVGIITSDGETFGNGCANCIFDDATPGCSFSYAPESPEPTPQRRGTKREAGSPLDDEHQETYQTTAPSGKPTTMYRIANVLVLARDYQKLEFIDAAVNELTAALDRAKAKQTLMRNNVLTSPLGTTATGLPILTRSSPQQTTSRPQGSSAYSSQVSSPRKVGRVDAPSQTPTRRPRSNLPGSGKNPVVLEDDEEDVSPSGSISKPVVLGSASPAPESSRGKGKGKQKK